MGCDRSSGPDAARHRAAGELEEVTRVGVGADGAVALARVDSSCVMAAMTGP